MITELGLGHSLRPRQQKTALGTFPSSLNPGGYRQDARLPGWVSGLHYHQLSAAAVISETVTVAARPHQLKASHVISTTQASVTLGSSGH